MSEIKYFAASKDLTVRRHTGNGATKGSGLSKRLYIGRHGNYDYDSYIEFNHDWTGVGKIVSAYIVGTTDDYGGSSDMSLPDSNDTPTVLVRRLKADFTEGNAPDGSWEESDYQNPSYTTSDQKKAVVTRAAETGFRIDITSMMEDYAPSYVKRRDGTAGGGKTNRGFGLYGYTDTDLDWAMFSSEATNASYRPQVELTYELGPTSPNAPTNLSPSGSVASIGGFQADFSDDKLTDYLAATQVQVYGVAHSGSAAASGNLITDTAHGLKVGAQIYFTALTGGSGLSTFTKYYVKTVPSSNTFTVSATSGGSTVDITDDYSSLTWRVLLWDKTQVASSVERINSRSDVTPEFTVPRNQNIAFRLRQKDQEAKWSSWTSLTSFTVTNTDPDAPVLTPTGATYSTLDGVRFRGSYSDDDSDAMLAYEIEMSAYAEGSPNWDDPNFLLWDTGKVYVGAGVTGFDVLYGGAPLAAGTYYWRARVWDSHDGVSLWAYGTVILDTDFVGDPEQASQQIQLRPRAPWRIVIKGMGANRGPGTTVAILENAKSVGASLIWNSPGEAHWTLAVDHPQISVIEPKQTHYSIQFYTGDGWREKFAGLVWDFDANEKDVVFFGIDYLALYDYVMDERYDPANPDKSYTKGGSKYTNVAISTIVSSQIDYVKALPNSPVGFITKGSIATMSEKVTVFSTYTPTLQLVTSLLESHRAGADKRTRVQVRPKAAGGYEIVVQDDPGVVRTNLRMRYGELVQGYRVVAFGPDWGTRLNAIGRQRSGLKVYYERATGAVSEATYGRFAKTTLVNDVEGNLDLRRRAKQMARSNSMLGQQLGLGLRTGVLGPRDGYDVTDLFPVSVKHGAVNTDNFGHNGYWVCLGVTWEAGDQGQQVTTLTLRPPDGGSAPSGNLLEAVSISPQREWQIGWTSPDVVSATSLYWTDQTTGKTYIRDGYGDAVEIEGSH